MAKGKLILNDKVCETIIGLELSLEEKGRLLEAILSYHLTGEVSVELSTTALVAFSFVKLDMDNNQESYKARQTNGRKGGAPKGNQNNINGRRGGEPTITNHNQPKPTITNHNQPKPTITNQENSRLSGTNQGNLGNNGEDSTSLINSFDINNISKLNNISKKDSSYEEPKESLLETEDVGTKRSLSTEAVDSLSEDEKVARFKKDGDIDFEKLAEYFNKRVPAHGIPQIVKMTPKRKALVLAREAEYGKDSIAKVIDKAAESSFLNGDNDRGWTASFDWLFNKTNYVKVLEDAYKTKARVSQELHNQDEKDYTEGGW